MEVKLISKEIIKPSSSTPPHLQTLRLCVLDQNGGLGHVPIILYYPKRDANFNINKKLINQLKDSLSETLTLFYPLAGRVKDDGLSIDCNDEGILFSTTRVNCDMANLLTAQPPNLLSLPRLLPVYVILDPRDKAVQVAIQLNIFACGGFVISGFFMHKIIDGATFGTFLKCWASNSIARSGISRSSHSLTPTTSASSSTVATSEAILMYPGASIFSSKQPFPDNLSTFSERMLLREGKGIIQRFVFNSEAISTLKAKATSGRVPNPTRVEVISAFIWKHAMAASRVVWGMQQPSILSQQMDLRRRILVTSSSKYSVGNFLWKVVAHCDAVAEDEEIMSLNGLVGLLRDAIEKTRDDILPKLQQGDEGGYEIFINFVQDLREIYESKKNLNPYMFSSWCKLGFNEVDFGWGNPAWISSVGARVNSIHKNNIFLIEVGLDDKIEAWVTLDEREMAVLERDKEFLEFAPMNPPIILS
ncbi:(13S,14R)-1,13-dihydroxy-N-methylcanadine 13-O-acetyltransferase AT1 [Camellia lanceoleosa]|nr:(13S,14R)-1,13-dihydroxy-N-methylcanadine 13-O-acetyltransferase AT1 [Camellia lanceoleosa]